jgi:DNA-binding PucR family transcriptional regulator
MCFSRAFNDYSNLRTHYILTKRIISLAPNLDEINRIFVFQEYSIYLVIDMFVLRFSESFSSSALFDIIHPDILILWTIDSRDNNNLTEVLYQYLINDRSHQKTAAATYIHRNTVSYKINQIIKLTNLNLDNSELCQRLIFSCQMLKYLTKCMQISPQQIDKHHIPYIN